MRTPSGGWGFESRLFHHFFRRVELENRSAHGRFYRVVDVDLVDISNEPQSKPGSPSVRSKDVANELGGFGWPQLDGSHLFSPPSGGDGCAPGSPQVAHPVDLAEGADQATPSGVLGDRHRRGPRQAALAAANGKEHVRTHRDAGGEEGLREVVKERDPRWDTRGFERSSHDVSLNSGRGQARLLHYPPAGHVGR